MCTFFFSSRRRHTRCLSDWSSDVCSSDLQASADAAWGRGNAFAALGLALTLSEFPKDHPAYAPLVASYRAHMAALARFQDRSEERRVGKECRSRRSACDYKKKSDKL